MGWTFNTKNPDAETNAPTIAAVGIVFTTLSLVVVLLRCYVRLFMIKKFGADDYTIAVTWFCSLGFTIVTILQSKWGLGLQNLSDMPTENIYNFGLLQYAGAPFYITSILGFKLSLLFSFYRIAIQRSHRIAIIIIIVAVTAFNFCFFTVQLNLCTPVAKQWDPSITTGNCLTAVPFYTSMASLTILFDVIIMILPFPVLLSTQIPPRKKLILICLFSLGTFITVIQIIRIQTIHSLQNYLDSSMLIMWSMVEANLGIIIASIPPLSPLIRSFSSSSGSSKSTSNNRAGTEGQSYSMGSMKGTYQGKDGRVRLGSQGDRGLRGGAEGKEGSQTVVKIGSYRYSSKGGVGGKGGDNSSEEYIIEGAEDGAGTMGGIRATTEVRIERDEEGSNSVAASSVVVGGGAGRGSGYGFGTGRGGDPFADVGTGVAS